MKHHIKLRGRLFIAFLIPVSLALGFSGIVYSISNQVADTFKQVGRTEKILISGNEMLSRIALMGRQVRGYLLTRQTNYLNEYEKQRLLYQEALKVADREIIDPEQRKRFTQLKELVTKYEQTAQEAIDLEKQGKHKEALVKSLQESQLSMGKIDDLNQELNKNEEKILNHFSTNANNSIQFLVIAATIMSLLTLACSVIAGYFIWTNIAGTIQQTVNTIANSTNEITATVTEQELSATQQATAVNQTTTAMDELGVSAKQSAEKAQLAASSAQQVSVLAAQGSQAIDRTLEDMLELKNTVVVIAEKIIYLSDRTNQISSIITLVTELANQTNMLALNAAVEAVRAGENGKGFAVVAAEIRKLADESKKSSSKINLLVNEIENAIGATVIVADEGKKRVDNSMKTAEDTANTFAKVAEAINDVVANNMQISLNAKQQAIAIQQVVDAMNTLNQGAVQTASGINQTKVGTQRLNEALLNLQTVI
ncbi:methyl-accepting chemotaxis protein [Aerosakkonemataceae cyanobacterium BLCC-F154]|uniref:Methyl-accepting chemotaxis protein n=1 Tax=Floridaenema fluviatile BLCC-F154 TaxID=3153640 RepID=A0ABV4Y9E1_9CYAN